MVNVFEVVSDYPGPNRLARSLLVFPGLEDALKWIRQHRSDNRRMFISDISELGIMPEKLTWL